MSLLVVDIGNTRIKWARVVDGTLVDSSRALHLGSSEQAFTALDTAIKDPITRVVAANVADEVFAARLARLAMERWHVDVDFVATCSEGFGVRCAYRDPERLGVDRWVALVAARSLASEGPACVVDAGTTVTFDAVDGDGEHLGGLIMAGPRMVAAALNVGTRRVGPTGEVATRPPGLELLGRSTDEAVGHGSMLALGAAIDRAADIVASELGTRPTVYLTGGEGPRLEAWIDSKLEYRADLVLGGLALIAAQS